MVYNNHTCLNAADLSNVQHTMIGKQNVDLSSAPWSMHEYFADGGLVAFDLKGMFASVWVNDIGERKADVYALNIGADHFELGDIKDV